MLPDLRPAKVCVGMRTELYIVLFRWSCRRLKFSLVCVRSQM